MLMLAPLIVEVGSHLNEIPDFHTRMLTFTFTISTQLAQNGLAGTQERMMRDNHHLAHDVDS